MNKNYPSPKYYLFLHFNIENQVSLSLCKNLVCSGHPDRPWEDTFRRIREIQECTGAEVGFRHPVVVVGGVASLVAQW